LGDRQARHIGGHRSRQADAVQIELKNKIVIKAKK
jgi:hypothetical protein